MMEPKQILCIHPHGPDLEIAALLNGQGIAAELSCIATKADLASALRHSERWDLILCDWSCYRALAVDDLLTPLRSVLDASLVLLKVSDDALSAAEAGRHGAADAVVADDHEHLLMVCLRELCTGSLRKELRELKARSPALADSSDSSDSPRHGLSSEPLPSEISPFTTSVASQLLSVMPETGFVPEILPPPPGALSQERINALINEGGLTLEFQPIVSFKATEDECGRMFETLVRLRDESGDLLAPGRFLPTLVQTGCMGRIDLWIFRRALAILEERQQQGESDIMLFINLDTQTLLAPDLIKAIGTFVRASRVAPGSVVVEVRGNAFATAHAALQLLGRMLRGKQHGLLIEDPDINDCAFLERHADILTHVKLDPSITRGLVERQISQRTLETYVKCAHQTGMRVIALAVDNAELLPLLFKAGVDAIQGHFVSMPYQNLTNPGAHGADADDSTAWPRPLFA